MLERTRSLFVVVMALLAAGHANADVRIDGVLVVVDEAEDVDGVLRAHGRGRVTNVVGRTLQIVEIVPRDEDDAQTLLHDLHHDRRVEHTARNTPMRLTTNALPNDGVQDGGRWLGDFGIDIDRAWDVTIGGPTALNDQPVVAVVDVGYCIDDTPDGSSAPPTSVQWFQNTVEMNGAPRRR